MERGDIEKEEEYPEVSWLDRGVFLVALFLDVVDCIFNKLLRGAAVSANEEAAAIVVDEVLRP